MSVNSSDFSFSNSSNTIAATGNRESPLVSENLSYLPTVRGATIFEKDRMQNSKFVRDLARAQFSDKAKAAPRTISVMIVDPLVVSMVAVASAHKASMVAARLRKLPEYIERFARLDVFVLENEQAAEKRELEISLRKQKAEVYLKQVNRLKRKNLELIDDNSEEFSDLITYYFELKPFGCIRIVPEQLDVTPSETIRLTPIKVEINPWFFTVAQREMIKKACQAEQVGYGEFSNKTASE